MFHGSIVALITPFKNNKIDLEALESLVEFHINNQTSAIVAAGTTGEAGTLTHEEKISVIKHVIQFSKDRIPVIAGTADNNTNICLKLTEEAMHLGAHAALIMTPAYIKPTQQGLYQHYALIAQAVPIPIILYNVPGRTAVDLLPETVIKLSRISNIIGIKDASGIRTRLDKLLISCKDELDVYSGCDESAAEWMLAGAKGVISVTANVVPELIAKMYKFAHAKDYVNCMEIHNKIFDLNELLFIESNPIPVKWLMAQMGLITEGIRMPLTTLSEHNQKLILQAASTLGLLK